MGALLVCVLVAVGCGGGARRGTTPVSRQEKMLYVPESTFALGSVASFRVQGADGQVYVVSASDVTLVNGRYVFDIPVAFDTGSLVYVFEDGTEGTYAFDEDDVDFDGDGVVDALDEDDDGDGAGDLEDADDDGDGVVDDDEQDDDEQDDDEQDDDAQSDDGGDDDDDAQGEDDDESGDDATDDSDDGAAGGDDDDDAGGGDPGADGTED